MCTIYKHFCTYQNKSTNGAWIKSHEYDSVTDLLTAMIPYLEKYPVTNVSFQFRTIYIKTEDEGQK